MLEVKWTTGPSLVSKVIDELKRRFVWESCKDKCNALHHSQIMIDRLLV